MTVSKMLRSIAVGMLAMAATQGAAQDLPEACTDALSETPMTLIVPNSPGGGYDTYARALAPSLAAASGTNVRVVNMPGGGGLIASTEVANQRETELLILIDSYLDLVTNNTADGASGATVEAFAPLGLIVSEPRTWVSTPGMDLFDPNLDFLVGAAGSIAASTLDIALVARALGLDVRVVSGYEGSSDTSAAVLRGETDFLTQTLGSAMRNVEGNDLSIVALLSDTPVSSVPDAPLFGGEHGLVAQRAADLPEAERATRMADAEFALDLVATHRGLMTASTVEGDRLDCLRQAVWIALLDAVFIELAEAQGREVDPTDWQGAERRYEAIKAAWTEVAPQIEALSEAITP